MNVWCFGFATLLLSILLLYLLRVRWRWYMVKRSFLVYLLGAFAIVQTLRLM